MQSVHALQDVVIIGGGPAGSTAATFLVRNGYRVTVLEKEKFPRDHVGESLLPFCYSIFQELGVLEEMRKRFVRKPGARFIDIDGRCQTTWCFGHVIKDPSYLSFHVLRAEFDQLLLNNASHHGATVREQTRVQQVDCERSDGLIEVQAIDASGKKQTYWTRFLLDASGRDTFLAKRMSWKKPHKELDRAALSTHWLDAKFTEGLAEGLLHIVYLGGEKKGWIWVIPIAVNRLSIGVVLNHSYIRQEKAQLAKKGVQDWQLALYRQELWSSDFVRDLLSTAHIAQPLMFNGDYSYTVEKKYGANFALIGDASAFIDPIFASGVYLSMNSARLVAQALHQKFNTGNGEGEAYLAEAYTQINGAYALLEKVIQMFYNPEAINFAQVGPAIHLLHHQLENILSVGHYLIAGDFFKNHKRYDLFLDFLQDAENLKNYKHFIIDRKEFQAISCGLQRSEIFPMLNDARETQG